MAELKTRPSDQSVQQFLDTLADANKRQDSLALMDLMHEVTGLEPVLWGSALIGFGRYHYRYDSGHEGDSFWTGFSPRKQALAVYLHGGADAYADLFPSLGRHKAAKSCLYIQRLSDVDPAVLRAILARSVEIIRGLYPEA